MPLEAGQPETRTMRYALAMVLGALALALPLAGSAAADPNVTELVTPGTADKTKGCEKVSRPRRG
jgi:hypothetical protein